MYMINKKWIYRIGVVGMVFASAFIICKSREREKKIPLTSLELPALIERQFQELRQTPPIFSEETEEEKNEVKQNHIEEDAEISLVEQISNPRLEICSWSTPGLVDPPYCSFAQEEQVELSEYGIAPRSNLELEKAKEWGEQIFYCLVLNPGTVREYGAILTKSSIEAWENFQWVYANPEDYYKEVYTYYVRDGGEYYDFEAEISMPISYYNDWGRASQLDRTLAEGVDRELMCFIYGRQEEELHPWLADGSHSDVKIVVTWRYECSTGFIQVTKINYQIDYK